jgi:SsrA-binding protein
MTTPVQEHAPQIHNRKARHEYHMLEKFEVGIVLAGTEVKSIRDGQCQLDDAFARVENDEVWLYGCHIAPYLPATLMNHEPKRPRKLLLHRREIRRLATKLAERGGATLIPLKMYWRRGFAKVELALAIGKSKSDKREDLKKRETEREIRREYAKN